MKRRLVLLTLLYHLYPALAYLPLQSDLIHELAMDEWPVEEEMAKLLQQEQYQPDMFPPTEPNLDYTNDEDDEEEEDEEDDVDDDDNHFDEDDNDNDIDNQGHYQDSLDAGLHPPPSYLLEKETPQHADDVDLAAANQPMSQDTIPPTSRLQLLEQKRIDELDRAIVTSLEQAIDTVKNSRPIRYIPLNDPPLVDPSISSTHASWSLASTFSLFLSLCILSLIVGMTWKGWRKRDYQLPTHQAYTKKSSVD
ncbi:hypothetical protein DM01DRAFT_1333760 [Hesseltinella vesiculosa]|uniref:Uncharacterized protein n=1 Tax=Hesseltinella vesiculosa TaxID=101127 RepID=A0A1X2GNV5_9FUNG|nr:hypothetical protein DM01DRAFT_1333760 [Hesseltinella vesiculosa]